MSLSKEQPIEIPIEYNYNAAIRKVVNSFTDLLEYRNEKTSPKKKAVRPKIKPKLTVKQQDAMHDLADSLLEAHADRFKRLRCTNLFLKQSVICTLFFFSSFCFKTLFVHREEEPSAKEKAELILSVEADVQRMGVKEFVKAYGGIWDSDEECEIVHPKEKRTKLYEKLPNQKQVEQVRDSFLLPADYIRMCLTSAIH